MDPGKPRTGGITHSSRSLRGQALGTGAGLGVMVVVVVMAVVPSGRERRPRTYQHQKGDEDDLLHTKKIARFCPLDMTPKMQESKPLRAIFGFPN